MNENISKLMILDQKINDFIDNNDLNDVSVDEKFENTHYVDKCINILKHMSNKDVLEAVKRFDYIPLFVDYKVFLKRYVVDKKKLKNSPELCLEEYQNVSNVWKRIDEIAASNKEAYEYMNILKLDNAMEDILHLMPNEDLMKLANNSSDWVEKLYFYSFFKATKK